jgi:uncharacterized protein YgiM (DUF1202 family)
VCCSLYTIELHKAVHCSSSTISYQCDAATAVDADSGQGRGLFEKRSPVRPNSNLFLSAVAENQANPKRSESMRKKIMAVVLSCLTFLTLVFSSLGTSMQASAVSIDEMTQVAVEIITRNEGTYGSINRNDNGAVSIGILQWHATRALTLMRSIANADTATAKSILGSTFYNEVMSSSGWSTRTFTATEATAAASLLTTSTGKSKQDALAFSDVQGYINAGKAYGLTNAGVLVYYAELYNRGSGVAARILSAAKGSGSYASITLSTLHNAALVDKGNSSGYYTSRLNDAYNTIVGLGWGDASVSTGSSTTTTTTTVDTSDFSDSYAGTYTVTASSLNIRSAPSTSASKVGSISNGATVTVTSGNGSWAAVTYNGVSGYCSMDYLKATASATTTAATTTAATTTTVAATTVGTSDFSDSYAGIYTVTASSLNIRSTPSASSTRVGSIPNGATVTVTSGNGSWAAVTYNGVSGYCSMDYLKAAASTTTTTTTAAAATTTTTTTTAAATTTTTASTTEATTTTTTTAVSVAVVGVSDPTYSSLYGDVNCDGVVDTSDVVLLQKYLNGCVYLNTIQLANADCQRDDVLDTTDITVIMQYLLANIGEIPVV